MSPLHKESIEQMKHSLQGKIFLTKGIVMYWKMKIHMQLGSITFNTNLMRYVTGNIKGLLKWLAFSPNRLNYDKIFNFLKHDTTIC